MISPKLNMKNIIPVIRMLTLLIIVLTAAIQPNMSYGAEPIRIGVLAFRPKPQTLAQWQPLAVALKKAMPERDFVIESFTDQELENAVASRQLDFVLTNPGHYIRLAKRSGLSAPLATLALNEDGQPVTVSGGVIFSLAGQANINKLSDIKGKTIAATSTDSLDGYQTQLNTLNQAGVSIPNDAKLITTGMPHDNVVDAVMTGKADVGFIRTGVLEAMSREGKLDMKQIKVLNRQNLPDFPVQVSTRLYPEWAFAALPHIDENLARHVAAVLFQLEENTAAVNAIGIHGFVVPADYSPVIDLLKELRAPPFETAPLFTLRDVLSRYRWQLITALLGLGAILVLSIRLLLTKRGLQSEQQVVLLQKQDLLASKASLQATIDAIPDLLFELGLDGLFYTVPSIHNNLLVAPPEDLVGKRVIDILPHHAANVVLKALQEAHENGRSQGRQFELQLPEGKKWYELSVAKKLTNDTQNKRFIVLSRDITQRKIYEEDLRIAATAFESQEGIIVTDINNVIIRVNHAFTNIIGYSAEEAIGQTPRLFKSDNQNAAFYKEMWERIDNTGKWDGEIYNKRKNGDIIPVYLIITAVKGADGIVTNYVATLIDITTEKAAAKEIEQLAFYDALTRLPNRRLLLDRLNHALAASSRSRRHGALLFLDLDHFKTLNDTLGHDFGDLLLKQVAERLKACIREGDTIARFGGDEFVVILEDLSEQVVEAAAQTEAIAKKVLASLNQPYLLAAYEHYSTASIGITLFNGHQLELEELIKQADIAMYQAKKAGRNILRFFDLKMQDTIHARVDIERELRKAIDNHQFKLYYQIQVDSLGHPLGAETLIRWLHPERGLVPPLEFIPLAEETGLILPIGKWVLDTACAQIKDWQQDASTRNLTLSVNVSAKQFHQADFVAQVQTTIKRHAINPMLLKLELTESMLLEKVDEIITTMNALKEIGVSFSLDDFGTGYSSLQYLKRLPLYQLKIDQSFVRDISVDNSDRAIVRTIIAMAYGLNLEVIAEGVETDIQFAYLRNYGCKQFQGYLFSKPVPIGEFEALLGKTDWQCRSA